jgi:hypothetical protein
VESSDTCASRWSSFMPFSLPPVGAAETAHWR